MFKIVPANGRLVSIYFALLTGEQLQDVL